MHKHVTMLGGLRGILTTEHPGSHYGQPVMLIDGEPHGPDDTYNGIPLHKLCCCCDRDPDVSAWADLDGRWVRALRREGIEMAP